MSSTPPWEIGMNEITTGVTEIPDASALVRDDDCCRGMPTSPGQSPTPPENSTIKRLQSELKDLMGTSPEAKNQCLKENSTDSPFNYPIDYPFKPPFVKFDRPAPFHPNVGASCYQCHGKIDLNILLEECSSAYDVRMVLVAIKTLLEDPNLSSPVNHDAASLWSDQKEHRKMVEKFYKPPQYGVEKSL